MKKVSCPCGGEFKTHTIEEIVEIANVHAKHTTRKISRRGSRGSKS